VRRQHYLRANHSSETVQQACWVDTETLPTVDAEGVQRHYLRFGWACFERSRTASEWCEPEWLRFTTPEDFWAWLEAHMRPKTRTYVFAHNWSFDALVVRAFDQLQDRGWVLKTAVIDAPPVILSWRQKDRTVTLLDTLNWWRLPLSAIGTSVGLDKLPYPGPDASESEWDTYGRRDVEVIHKAIREWLAFLQYYDLGSFAPTLPSQSLRAFRHRFMRHKILIDDNESSLAMARDSYHGGRTECFHIGRIEGPIHALDINSMYPWAMKQFEYPARLVLHCRYPEPAEVKRWLKSYCVIARVRLRTKRNRYAHVHDKRLVFPIGRLLTALTTPDLEDAYAHDEVESVTELSLYDPEPIFASFVEEVYAMRKTAIANGDKVRAWLLKYVMNQLYGKFAQRGETWNTIHNSDDRAVRVWTEYDAVTGETHRMRQLGGAVQVASQEPESRDSHPAIAAHVAAYARARLWELIQAAGPANVFYCDTDSLYVNSEGRARLESHIDPLRLGALKEESVSDSLTIHGPKDYVLGAKRVCKGVRERAAWLAPNVVEQERWSSLRGSVFSGDFDAPTTRLQRRILRRTYEKGVVSLDGSVSPLALTEW
jgi:hypothetical protein